MNEKILTGLEPKIVWDIFEEITKIPHPSRKEEKIRLWIKKWAKENNVEVKKEDNVGNLLLTKVATKGCEKFPVLILQAHMDMVCQKFPSVTINFEKDPLKIKVDGEKVLAEGTSLGADNGIGMAISLAVLSSEELKHGPLEVLFTVDEETGLSGALELKKGFFTGKYLLNIDSEEIGKITISSAGGGDTDIYFTAKFEKLTKANGVKINISGLKGGHSGVDIDLPRLNAIKIGTDVLLEILNSNVQLCKIDGGSAHNAIPRDFSCEVYIPSEKMIETMKKLDKWKEKTIKIGRQTEPKLKIDIEKITIEKVISSEKTKEIANLLGEIHHGPICYSKEIKSLVQTSNNLAEIKQIEDQIHIKVNTRSAVDKELEDVRKELKELAEKHGAKVILNKAYQGWKPNLKSPFLELVKKLYEETINSKVELLAIHAGLECGLFYALDPNLQMVSIGPNLKNAHSPEEYVEIKSVNTIWELVKKIITNIGTL